MNRLNTVSKLPPEHQATVDALLRRHRYAALDAVRHQLADRGIKISRSTLGRYALRLRATDTVTASGQGPTLIIIDDSRSDETKRLRTHLEPGAVLAALATLEAAAAPSETSAAPGS